MDPSGTVLSAGARGPSLTRMRSAPGLGISSVLLAAACAALPDPGEEPPVDACPCPDRGDGDSRGCDGSNALAAQPFGNHAHVYAPGTILPSHVSRAQRDDAVRGYYDFWKARYLRQGCGEGRWYVATGHAGSLTVSEAHGYGMLIVAYLAGHEPQARAIFDGMVAYFKDHPSEITPSLMAWSQDAACANNQGAASAADGDLDIAYALLVADKQWSSGGAVNYRAEAQRILGGIRSGDVDASGSYIRLGDWTSGNYYNATRSSDFMPGHLASFAAATGDPVWRNVADRSYQIMDSLQRNHAPQTGLLPDFITSPLANPRPVDGWFLERQVDGQYSYNACRDPWRIAMDVLHNGDSRARTLVERMLAWVKGAAFGDPYRVVAGYTLGGQSLGNHYVDMAFIAPLGVAAMVDPAHQDWLDRSWDAIVATRDTGYYADTLALLALIAMSGNWWAPEAAPCPS
jgi:endoglucanase